eukprot:2196762-Amphidinium_carterae.1
MASRLKTIHEILNRWGESFPVITSNGVRCLGATLRAGGYRSAKVYLSAARVEMQKHLQGGTFPAS